MEITCQMGMGGGKVGKEISQAMLHGAGRKPLPFTQHLLVYFKLMAATWDEIHASPE